MTGKAKSKWLHGEGDDEWEMRIGRGNNAQKLGDNNFAQSKGSGYEDEGK